MSDFQIFKINFYVRNSNGKASKAFGLLSGKIWNLAVRIAKDVLAYGKAT